MVRTAVDLGVDFLDTAEAYGTEKIVGAAARSYDRDKLVISTKAIFNTSDTAETVTRKVEASLKRLGPRLRRCLPFPCRQPGGLRAPS